MTVEELEKEAQAGDTSAMVTLADMYIADETAGEEGDKAYTWLKKAADLGYVVAMYKLGLMYKEGKGRKQDHQQAYTWFKKAAALGHEVSSRLLGEVERYIQEEKEQKAAEQAKKGSSSNKKLYLGLAIILLVGGFAISRGMDKASSKKIPTKQATTTQQEVSKQSTTTKPKQMTDGAIKKVRMKAIIGVAESSALKTDDYTYSAKLTVDGDIATCWAEGTRDLGIGESVMYMFNNTYLVSGFNIWVGHQKSEYLFQANARPSVIKVIGSNGQSEKFTLQDKMGMQRCTFARPMAVSSLRIVLEKVKPGYKYVDTCIAEVNFF